MLMDSFCQQTFKLLQKGILLWEICQKLQTIEYEYIIINIDKYKYIVKIFNKATRHMFFGPRSMLILQGSGSNRLI